MGSVPCWMHAPLTDACSLLAWRSDTCLSTLTPLGRVPWRLSSCQTQGKLQDIPEEQGPPSHHIFQPWRVSQACSSQSWPNQPCHHTPPCPMGNTTSALSCLPRQGPKAPQARGQAGQGCRTAWVLWCSVTTVFLPGWSFTISLKGISVLQTDKKPAGLAARHCRDPAGCQHKHQDEDPVCLQKCGGSYEEGGGHTHHSAAGGEASSTL